jgi:hypothetical protein
MMQRSCRLALIASLACALLSCAGARRRALLDLSEERLSRARALRAEALAPAPFQHFQRARERAQKARPDSAERADRSTEARLWLEVAISQAEQTALAQQRLAVERENVRLDEAFLAQEQQRLALEDASELREAAAIAQLEAERALARAALAPAQRSKLSSAEVERAARSLLERAELIALALPPGAVPPAAVEQLAKLREEARGQLSKAPERALTLADRALFQALSLVGTLRAGKSAPDAAQKASLAEGLKLAGTRVVRDERGLTASLSAAPGAFGPAGLKAGAFGPAMQRSVARLCSLAQSYPQGPVQVRIDAGAAAHKVALQKLLTDQGCTGERFSVVAAGHASAGNLSFTWLAY